MSPLRPGKVVLGDPIAAVPGIAMPGTAAAGTRRLTRRPNPARAE